MQQNELEGERVTRLRNFSNFWNGFVFYHVALDGEVKPDKCQWKLGAFSKPFNFFYESRKEEQPSPLHRWTWAFKCFFRENSAEILIETFRRGADCDFMFCDAKTREEHSFVKRFFLILEPTTKVNLLFKDRMVGLCCYWISNLCQFVQICLVVDFICLLFLGALKTAIYTHKDM